MDEQHRVVHVDADPDVVQTVVDRLEANDTALEVTAETSGSDALDRVMEDSVDCVVSGYRLPNRDGLDLLEAVRDYDPEVPFLLFPEDGGERVASEATCAGVTDYVSRAGYDDPFEELADRVDRAIEEYHRSRTTDGTESERALEHERVRFYSLFRNVEHPSVYVELDGEDPVIEDANPAFEETFGVEATAVRGEPLDDVVVPEEQRDEAESINDRVRRGETVTHEVERKTADGRRTFDLHAVPLRPGERSERAFAIYRDVTEQRRNQSRLAALNEFGTSIHEETGLDAVCRRTVATATELLDMHLCTILLREGDKLVPRATSEQAPEDGSRTMDLDEGLAGRTYQTGESFVVDDATTDDTSKPAKESYSSGISVPVGDRGVFQAVSRRRGAFDDSDLEMAELLVSHAASAMDAIERRRRLEHQKDRLDEFVSIVTHDLRNPIEIVTANLELARSDPQEYHFERMDDALERMTHIIDDTLTLARQGETVGELSVVDLATTSERAWKRVDGCGAELVIDDDRRFMADPDRLDHVLENLFSNAVEHGPADGGSDAGDGSSDDRERCSDAAGGLTIRVGTVGDDGVYVADDGRGIPANHLDEVFHRNYTTTDEVKGFGLNIVERIVEAHGWEIRATNGEDGGARFEITGLDVVD